MSLPTPSPMARWTSPWSNPWPCSSLSARAWISSPKEKGARRAGTSLPRISCAAKGISLSITMSLPSLRLNSPELRIQKSPWSDSGWQRASSLGNCSPSAEKHPQEEIHIYASLRACENLSPVTQTQKVAGSDCAKRRCFQFKETEFASARRQYQIQRAVLTTLQWHFSSLTCITGMQIKHNSIFY